MAADLALEIDLALFEGALYGHCIVAHLLAARGKFAWWSALSFQGMPD